MPLILEFVAACHLALQPRSSRLQIGDRPTIYPFSITQPHYRAGNSVLRTKVVRLQLRF